MKAVAPEQSKWAYFLMASFIVGAALVKAGAPLAPILLAIAACGAWNLRRKS
jgi:Sec-independent protein secretion pathway component TatC